MIPVSLAKMMMMLTMSLLYFSLVSASRINFRGLRGNGKVLQDFAAESEPLESMCDDRPRNASFSHHRNDNAWHRQCHDHWAAADSQAPIGQWTQEEFTNFVQLQVNHASSFSEFKQLPLSLKLIFNDLSCKCLEHEGHHDCCHGANAKISPGPNALKWMDSICNRVDYALDEVCRREQMKARAGEL